MKNKDVRVDILERFMLGELPEAQMKEISAAVDTNPSLQRTIRELERSNSEILTRYSPESFITRLNSLAHKNEDRLGFFHFSRKIGPRAFQPVLLGIIGICLVWIFLSAILVNEREANSVIGPDRIKGNSKPVKNEIELKVYRKKETGIELLDASRLLFPSDLIQLAYVSKRGGYGVIFSIDSRDHLSLHFPSTAEGDQRLISRKPIYLERSFEMDESSGTETFYFLHSPTAIDLPTLLEHIDHSLKKGNFYNKLINRFKDYYTFYSIQFKRGEIR